VTAFAEKTAGMNPATALACTAHVPEHVPIEVDPSGQQGHSAGTSGAEWALSQGG
jgi:hypothetical protein